MVTYNMWSLCLLCHLLAYGHPQILGHFIFFNGKLQCTTLGIHHQTETALPLRKKGFAFAHTSQLSNASFVQGL